MDIPVVVALIAAAGGLITALITSGRQKRMARDVAQQQGESAQQLARLQEELKVKSLREERRHAALEQLNRYREPLLSAARDAGDRLRNIREGSFLIYLHHPDKRRRRLALLSTLYRLGRYWAVVESLYDSVSELRFATEEETKKVASLLKEISRTFANDAYGSPQFMVWREEQRGIADLMRDRSVSGAEGVMGFARFMDGYDTTMVPWFEELEQDLQADDASAGHKLEDLQTLFDKLTSQLKADRPRTL
ncbi:hypothetical protein [Sinomonas terrae]|uniref:C-type cytochrome biogenesis protein CcmI n=1 Tax=Sinomonas terrae TaxID=2908838 RepID=A0ABS9U1Z6_9MICC|nr:hypothetical protein [Sinomonas terrae]MCH6470675.1 hypothetical protein [Sinomonas terrae]